MMSCICAGDGWYEILVPEDLLGFLVHLSPNQNITTNAQGLINLDSLCTHQEKAYILDNCHR